MVQVVGTTELDRLTLYIAAIPKDALSRLRRKQPAGLALRRAAVARLPNRS